MRTMEKSRQNIGAILEQPLPASPAINKSDVRAALLESQRPGIPATTIATCNTRQSVSVSPQVHDHVLQTEVTKLDSKT